MRLPDELQQALDELTGNFDPRALARATRELTAHYNRADCSVAVLSAPEHRAAYLLTRLPATYAANRQVLLEAAGLLPGIEMTSMLDLCAGPGTSMWAAREVFPHLRNVTLVERDQQMAALGKKLAAGKTSQAAQSATWVHADLAEEVLIGAGVGSAGTGGQVYDLVVISYGLGELHPRAAERLVARTWQLAKQMLVILEPGTPRNFKTVLAARQQLITSGAHILAPCPHHEICPMAAGNDWCHFSVRLERTGWHRRLKGGELGYEDEKFCYLIATRLPANRGPARIVRHPLFRPGQVQLSLCTSEGLKHETVGKSQKEHYRRARKSKWGDLWAT
jgi:ribosomal protein RSM22 (predicted rRNA methylase)